TGNRARVPPPSPRPSPAGRGSSCAGAALRARRNDSCSALAPPLSRGREARARGSGGPLLLLFLGGLLGCLLRGLLPRRGLRGPRLGFPDGEGGSSRVDEHTHHAVAGNRHVFDDR